MSTAVIFQIREHTATPPSLAELRRRIQSDEALPMADRRAMASALTILAKAIGRPPEAILAEPASLRVSLAGLTPAMVGHKAGRWRNIQSLTTKALTYAGIVIVQGRIRAAPTAAWRQILKLIQPTGSTADAGRHFHLWRFARYCGQMGVEPGGVDDTVIHMYRQDLEHRSMVAEPARAARDAARLWNAAAGSHSGWPQQRLQVADNRGHYALPLDSYPESLRSDVAAWIEWLAGDDPFLDRDFNPLKPASVVTRRRELTEYLAALVHGGVAQASMVDLAAVVTPARARVGLRFFWDRAGKQHSLHGYHICTLVLQIARHWAKLPKADIDTLRSFADRCRPTMTGITNKNTARLRQLEDPEKLAALLTLPGQLMEEARRAGTPTIALARQVQVAVMIELLLHVPLRLKNLRELRVGVDLLVGPGKAMSLAIPGAQIKNGVPVNASLPDQAARLIATYLQKYRPLLVTAGENWLFPGTRKGAPKTAEGLRSAMQRVIAERCGVQVNPHLFRHFAAWMTLRERPDAHGQVQRILGHKSLSSTMAFYSGLESAVATDQYGKLIDGLRDAARARADHDARSEKRR